LKEPAKLSAFAPYITRRKSEHLVQFLMALCSYFESLLGLILHRNPLSFIDDVVNELLVEKIILASQSQANIALQSQGTSSLNISPDKWIIDSSVTDHMSHHLPSFVSLSHNSFIC